MKVLAQACGWVKRARLVEATGLSDRRLRRAVESLVLRGYPIATSSSHGYKLTRERAELQEAIADLRSKARALHGRADVLQQILDRGIDGPAIQPALFPIPVAA